MCLPAIGAAVGVLSSVASFAAAQADYNAKAQAWKTNFTNAMKAGVEDQKQIALKANQEGEQYVEKQHLQEVQGAEAEAQAETSAAAGGVGGISVNNIIDGLRRDVAYNQGVNETNYKNTVVQLQAENRGTETQIENQINSMQKPTSPNALGYILQGVGGVLKDIPVNPSTGAADWSQFTKIS